MSAKRSSRRVALMLAEINRTIATIEANGQAGSVAHQKLIAQKIELMGLGRNSKTPDAASAESKSGSGKTPTYTPWPEDFPNPFTDSTLSVPKVVTCGCGHLRNQNWPAGTVCTNEYPWHKLPEEPRTSILTSREGN
jgi:hypothetical protein